MVFSPLFMSPSISLNVPNTPLSMSKNKGFLSLAMYALCASFYPLYLTYGAFSLKYLLTMYALTRVMMKAMPSATRSAESVELVLFTSLIVCSCSSSLLLVTIVDGLLRFDVAGYVTSQRYALVSRLPVSLGSQSHSMPCTSVSISSGMLYSAVFPFTVIVWLVGSAYEGLVVWKIAVYSDTLSLVAVTV